MKRRIVVTIDVNAKTCGRCSEFFKESPFYFFKPNVCTLFHTPLFANCRHKNCLAAERAYKEATSGTR